MSHPDILKAYRETKRIGELKALLPIDPGKARKSLEQAQEQQPEDTNVLLLLARSCLLCGDPLAAGDALEKLVSLDSGNGRAWGELAKVHFAQGHIQAAIMDMERATGLAPEIDENWRLLSLYLQQDGQDQQSEEARQQYEMIRAFNDKLAAANQAFAGGDFLAAEKICRQLHNQVPNELRVLRLLARLARHSRHFEVSESILARCVDTAPADVDIGTDYTRSLIANGKHHEALVQCQRLIDLAPDRVDLYEIKAEILSGLGRAEEAVAIYRSLSEIHEKRALAFLRMGKLLAKMGEEQRAIDSYQQVLASEFMPGQSQLPGEVYLALSEFGTYRFSNDTTALMKKLAKDDYVTELSQSLIHFALGRVYEDKEKFATSFKHYDVANKLISQGRSSNYRSPNEKLISFFTADYFSNREDSGSPDASPIFLVGLPCSGLTRVEGILSGHSQVDPTGKLNVLNSMIRELGSMGQSGHNRYPGSLSDLNPVWIESLAQRYLEHAGAFRRQAPHFIDKTQGNFLHIGLIRTLFPRARIIEIRRDAMECGWNLYRNYFSDRFPFSSDLSTIGQYINDYIEIMNHWHEVLPQAVLTIEYETLAHHTAEAVDAMLRYCGLEPEAACCQSVFDDNARPHWKNFEEFLSPLKNALNIQT